MEHKKVKVRKRNPEHGDAEALTALGLDEKTYNASNVLVAEEDGKVIGWAAGFSPEGGAGILGQFSEGLRTEVFDALLAAHVEEAVELGHEYGEARVLAEHKGIIEYLRKRWGLEPEPCGWEPGTKYKVVKEWLYRVDLKDFLEQLRRGTDAKH